MNFKDLKFIKKILGDLCYDFFTQFGTNTLFYHESEKLCIVSYNSNVAIIDKRNVPYHIYNDIRIASTYCKL